MNQRVFELYKLMLQTTYTAMIQMPAWHEHALKSAYELAGMLPDDGDNRAVSAPASRTIPALVMPPSGGTAGTRHQETVVQHAAPVPARAPGASKFGPAFTGWPERELDTILFSVMTYVVARGNGASDEALAQGKADIDASIEALVVARDSQPKRTQP